MKLSFCYDNDLFTLWLDLTKTADCCFSRHSLGMCATFSFVRLPPLCWLSHQSLRLSQCKYFLLEIQNWVEEAKKEKEKNKLFSAKTDFSNYCQKENTYQRVEIAFGGELHQKENQHNKIFLSKVKNVEKRNLIHDSGTFQAEWWWHMKPHFLEMGQGPNVPYVPGSFVG